jgi:hypothetical protein
LAEGSKRNPVCVGGGLARYWWRETLRTYSIAKRWTMEPIWDFMGSWAFIIGMGCALVALILSPFVIVGIVLLVLRRQDKKRNETENPSL